MSENAPFLILEKSCDAAIDWVVQQINQAGMQVVRTFDLHVARGDHAGCPCPHHDTDQCDCQMVVLLIYWGERQPVSLVAHGHDRGTWFSIVNTPQQHADPHLETAIRMALLPNNNATILKRGSQSRASV